MPLVMEGRDLAAPLAATHVARGTDVDFGRLTRSCSPAWRAGAGSPCTCATRCGT